jgi:hypothetical protein
LTGSSGSAGSDAWPMGTATYSFSSGIAAEGCGGRWVGWGTRRRRTMVSSASVVCSSGGRRHLVWEGIRVVGGNSRSHQLFGLLLHRTTTMIFLCTKHQCLGKRFAQNTNTSIRSLNGELTTLGPLS